MGRRWVIAEATILALAIALPGALDPRPVRAAEVTVLSAVAVKSALDDLVGKFEQTTGNKITVSYGTAGDVLKRLQAGESAGVAILPKPRLDELVHQGKVAPGSTRDFATGEVGLAVRAGTSRPDISSPEALKRSLLAAKSISYADPAKGGASGVHFARVLEQLGVADQMKPKTKLVPGPEAPDLASRGEVEIAVAMVPEILTVRGAELVGPLPQELQNKPGFTYVAGLMAGSAQPEAAKSLIQFISSPEADAVIKSKGLQPG